MNQLPICVVVSIKNEEANLPECLSRLSGFEDVVVVDSDSSDGSPAIVREAGFRLVNFRWNGHFPKKRNWALLNCGIQSEWVLFIDADEYVSVALVEELRFLLPHTSHAGFWVRYSNVFLGRRLRFGDPFRKIALVRRGCGEYEAVPDESWSHLDMEVHEQLVPSGSVGEVRGQIIHNDRKGLHSYIGRHNEYSSWESKRYLALMEDEVAWLALTSRQRLKYRLLDTWFLGPFYFLGAYFGRLGFLDGKAGLLLAFLKGVYFVQVKVKIDELRP